MSLVLALILMATLCQPQTLLADESTYYEFYLEKSNLPLGTLFSGLTLGKKDSGSYPQGDLSGGILTDTDKFRGYGLTTDYETESIMFNCRELIGREQKELPLIHKAFHSFGFYIGRNNAARWVGNESASSFDLLQGKELCDRFHLDYNGGPYIVHYRILNSSPLLDERGDLRTILATTDNAVINLGVVAPASRYLLINRLEQAIRRRERVSNVLLYEQNKLAFIDFFKENSGFLKDIFSLSKSIVEIRVLKKV